MAAFDTKETVPPAFRLLPTPKRTSDQSAESSLMVDFGINLSHLVFWRFHPSGQG
jgi:hypothetical protein